MDDRIIRQHLAEITTRLKQLDEEREVLVTLVHGYEGWLRVFAASNGKAPQPTAQLALETPRRVRHTGNKPQPGSWRTLAGGIVKEAQGAPIHSKEVYARAKARGLTTTSKNPLSAVDLTLRSIPGVERVGPRLWRWAGEPATIAKTTPTPGSA